MWIVAVYRKWCSKEAMMLQEPLGIIYYESLLEQEKDKASEPQAYAQGSVTVSKSYNSRAVCKHQVNSCISNK